MDRIKLPLPLTKARRYSCQLIGFALIIAAILRLLSRFSLGRACLNRAGRMDGLGRRENAAKKRRQKQRLSDPSRRKEDYYRNGNTAFLSLVTSAIGSRMS
jgi:hypothetical protein